MQAYRIDVNTKEFIGDIIDAPQNPNDPNIITTRPPEGLHRPKWNGTQWVEFDPVSALTSDRNNMKSKINFIREQKITEGFVYVLNGEKITVQTDLAGQRNLLTLTVAAIILKSQGQTKPSLKFRDADNNDHLITPDQMIAMGLAVQTSVSALYEKSWVKKAEVDQSQNPKSVNIDLEI